MTKGQINGLVVMMSSLLVMATGFGMSGLAPGATGWRVAATLAVAALVATLVAVAHAPGTGHASATVVVGGHARGHVGGRLISTSQAGADEGDVVILDSNGGHPVIIVGGRPWRGSMPTARGSGAMTRF